MGKYDVLFAMDGNEATADEFDAVEGNSGKFFFREADDATQQDKDRVKVLNFVHRVLDSEMARHIPGGVQAEDIEILHAAEFQGIHLQVVVVYRGKKRCYATVKVVDAEGKDVVYEDPTTDGNLTTEKVGKAKKNKHTKGGGLIKETPDKVNDAKAVVEAAKETLPGAFGVKTRSYINHDWVPRWAPLVSAIKDRMYFDFDKWGREMYAVVEDDYNSQAEEEKAAATDGYVPTGSTEEVEETMEIFCGCIGKIIGPKGATLYEIQDSTNAKIQMPPKNEDGPRPRARDIANITITGTHDNIHLAKAKVQKIVDEWANAPREPRGGGGGGSQNFYASTSNNEPEPTVDSAPSGEWVNSGGWGTAEPDGGSGAW